ncbi:MAG: KAP family NTPase [Acetatifactor sp.]|nr:KAP family NTPase [Acetatifactor sp.]
MAKGDKEAKKVFKYGITDVPQPIAEDDILEVKKYVSGLEDFIKYCPTPMSIALQGDWGTGKTTFLKTMESDFNEENGCVKTIYFNTWQYSQFNQADKLYESFLSNIVSQLESDGGEIVNQAQNVLKQLWKLTTGIIKDVAMNYAEDKVKNVTGLSLTEELVNQGIQMQKDRIEFISSLKDEFTKLIGSYVSTLAKRSKSEDENPRIVIFVDDLDRLNPARAVEMLEVLKLFMDVENCVYVLAIDYDVVVSGVRQKYGSNMTEDKCRSFFDKIIQLPFSMPVNAYRIEKMLSALFPDELKSYQKVVETYIGQTLGMNPRTIKRLSNSYRLLEAVEKVSNGKASKKRSELQHALLLLTLTTQMYSDLAYDEIARCRNAKALKIKLGQLDEEVQEEEQISDAGEVSPERRKADNALNCLSEAYEQINEILEESNKEDRDLAAHWIAEIHLSSITNVASAERHRSASGEIIAVVGDEPYSDKNATNVFRFIVQNILAKYQDRLGEILEGQKKWLTVNPELKGEGYFKRTLDLEVKYGDQPVILGIHTSNMAKRNLIKKLCKQLKLAKDEVQWIEDDNNLLSY